MFVCMCAYIGYFCGKGIEKGIDYVKGTTETRFGDEDRDIDRSANQSSSTIGYSAEIARYHRTWNSKDRWSPMYTSREGWPQDPQV